MKEKVMAAAVQMDIALFDEAANLAYMESAIKKAKEEKRDKKATPDSRCGYFFALNFRVVIAGWG